MKKVIDIGGKKVGEGCSCLIVAEIGINHDGKKAKAKELIRAAADSGADAVKVQSFRVDEFLSPSKGKIFKYKAGGKTVTENSYDMFKKRELKWEWHAELMEYAGSKGLVFFSTPQSEEGVDMLDGLGVPAFKIGSDDLIHYELIKYTAGKHKPLFLSTGMATVDEIDGAVKSVKDAGNKDLVLFHCVSLYPADPGHVNLKAMSFLKKRYGVPVGFSDHTLGIAVPIAAAALGACAIEKHFTLKRSGKGPDHIVSLEPKEMEGLVKSVRTAEKALGEERKAPVAAEETARLNARRSIVAARDINEGEALTRSDVAFKRPGTGMRPSDLVKILGMKARKNIMEGEIIEPGSLGKWS